MQTYFETDFIIISYDQAGNIIIGKWLIPPTSEEYREGIGAVFLAIKNFKTGRVIWDFRHLGTVSIADQEWTITNFHNPALEFGYSRAAVIMPPDIFTQMSVEAMASEISDFQVRYFDSMETATEWIKQF